MSWGGGGLMDIPGGGGWAKLFRGWCGWCCCNISGGRGCWTPMNPPGPGGVSPGWWPAPLVGGSMLNTEEEEEDEDNNASSRCLRPIRFWPSCCSPWRTRSSWKSLILKGLGVSNSLTKALLRKEYRKSGGEKNKSLDQLFYRSNRPSSETTTTTNNPPLYLEQHADIEGGGGKLLLLCVCVIESEICFFVFTQLSEGSQVSQSLLSLPNQLGICCTR